MQGVLADCCACAVVLDGDYLRLNIEENQIPLLENTIKAFARDLGEDLDYSVQISHQDDTNWVQEYQKTIDPVEVGGFYIHTSWHKPKQGKKNILIDPEVVFGTGSHATTASCLRVIDGLNVQDLRCLDLGTGTGILAMALALKGAQTDFCDTDENALRLAREHFKASGLSHQRSWLGSLPAAKGKYDLIAANLVSDILITFKRDFASKLNARGLLILSGILEPYADKTLAAFSGFTLMQKITERGWVTLLLKKEDE